MRVKHLIRHVGELSRVVVHLGAINRLYAYLEFLSEEADGEEVKKTDVTYILTPDAGV